MHLPKAITAYTFLCFYLAVVVLALSMNNSKVIVEAFSASSPSSASSSLEFTNDWTEAHASLERFPRGPSLGLAAHDLAVSCLRSLQFVDEPYEQAGLIRIYPFLTWECKRSITSTATYDSIIDFCQQACLSPVLQPFFGATRIEFMGPGTLSSPGSQRGPILSYPVKVHAAANSIFQHQSGMIRNDVSSQPRTIHMILRLEQSQRPPSQYCWMIREIANADYAKGGMGWSRDEGV